MRSCSCVSLWKLGSWAIWFLSKLPPFLVEETAGRRQAQDRLSGVSGCWSLWEFLESGHLGVGPGPASRQLPCHFPKPHFSHLLSGARPSLQHWC